MYKLLLFCLWLPCLAAGQPKPGYYTNILKNKTGQPIAGATISNRRAHTAVATDSKGQFSVAAQVGDTIFISSVGYATSQVIITPQLLQTPANNSPQAVAAIISPDYAALVKSTADNSSTVTDSAGNLRYSQLRLAPGSYTYSNIAEVYIRNHQLFVNPAITRRLSFGGSFSITTELKSANNQPTLQNQYAQGWPENGRLQWNGPETGEPFSFGPALATLRYDGSPYLYDVQGGLASSGNGKAAQAYDNSILQTAFLQSQSVQLHSRLYNGNSNNPLLSFTLQAGQTGQQSIVQQNRNSNQRLQTAATFNKGQLSITGTYALLHDYFAKGNRNGLLNRLYQNSLLTPVSFSNEQGAYLLTGQRSYSTIADNPYFLLSRDDNAYNRRQTNASLTIEQKGQHWQYRLVQSLETIRQVNNETYQRGTAFWEDGIATRRTQADNSYALQANISYNASQYHFQHTASAGYHLQANGTDIRYTGPGSSYHYQRTAQDFLLNWSGTYSSYPLEVGGTAANQFFVSGTASKALFLLPSASSFLKIRDVLDGVDVKLNAAYQSYASELPLQQSLAHTGLLQLPLEQAFRFFPVTEVSSYNGLAPIQHQDWTGGLSINWTYHVSFNATVFSRTTLHDVFPVYESGQLHLKNLANHRSQGIELQLSTSSRNYYSKKLAWEHNLSFLACRNRVTAVEPGYENLPIAGFADVHKTLIAGQPLGLITGSAWLRDGQGNKIIGSDGFPIKSSQAQVIGNPNPDFIVKLNNSISWRNWRLSADWEWQKGGDTWNGTQAVLDYYGRSAQTAALRNVSGYVFDGVSQTGGKNAVPVSLFNVNQPLQTAYWVRYGYGGVAEAYVQKSDYLRLRNLSLSYRRLLRKIEGFTITAYASNILLWSAAEGIDPTQLLYDQPNTEGLQFFNLPSAKSFGINATLLF